MPVEHATEGVVSGRRSDDSVAPACQPDSRPSPVPGRPSLRILHVFSFFRPDFTGEGLYVEKLAPHLLSQGIRNFVLASRTQGTEQHHANSAIELIRYFGKPDRQQRESDPAMLAWFIAHARHYDVVHLHSPVDRLFLLHLAARLLGCPVVQSCTLDDSLGRLVSGYRAQFRPLVRRLCRLINAMVAISPGLYEDCISVLPTGSVHLIPQGVEIPQIDPAARARDRARFGFGENDIVLIYVGAVCRRKDPLFLIDLHHLLQTPTKRVRLMLVGPELEPDYGEAVRCAIAASPCGDRITLHDYMEDPSPIYRLADLFVFASSREGFGNVLLEAMAHGLPVVSRRLLGVTDSFIEHGRSGFLFDTADEYVEAVRTLVSQPELRRAWGTAARDAVVSSHALPDVAGRYAALYRSLAGRGAPS